MNPRRLLARFLAWAYDLAAGPQPDLPDAKILSASFETFEDQGWTADLTVQSEATKWLAFTMAACVHDAPNFVTGGFRLKAVDGRYNVYEMTVQRMGYGHKTPQERIAELETELEALRPA